MRSISSFLVSARCGVALTLPDVSIAPLTTVLGSMVADRLADTLMVLLLTILTFVVASGAINAFLVKYPVGRGLVDMVSDPLFWAAVVGGIALAWGLLYFFRHTRFVGKLRGWTKELWNGFAVVAKMPGKGRFLLLTMAIWGCYYVQLYVAFFAFPFTRELCADSGLAFGLVPCLVAFVLSSIGMAVPSNGGSGHGTSRSCSAWLSTASATPRAPRSRCSSGADRPLCSSSWESTLCCTYRFPVRKRARTCLKALRNQWPEN